MAKNRPAAASKRSIWYSPAYAIPLIATIALLTYQWPESQFPANEQLPPPPPPRSLLRRILTLAAICSVSAAAGFALATMPTIMNMAKHRPTDTESLSLFRPDNAKAAAVAAYIDAHPLTQSLRADPALRESRPHMLIPPAARPLNLTAGTLLGPDKIVVPPLAFNAVDGSRAVWVQYLGSGLCGHPGIVHGGLLATMLDEGLARCCFPALPNKFGVTACLKVDYRKPCPAESFVVLRATTVKVEGRKAWVTGRIESLVDESQGETPVVFAEAEALFVEPKQAAVSLDAQFWL